MPRCWRMTSSRAAPEASAQTFPQPKVNPSEPQVRGRCSWTPAEDAKDSPVMGKNLLTAPGGVDVLSVTGKDAKMPSKNKDVLYRPLMLIRLTLRLLGIVPYTYSRTLQEYVLAWRSVAALHTLLVFAWLTALLITTSVGLVRMFLRSQFLDKSSESHETELLGVVIIVGCLLNAWVEVLNVVLYGHPICKFLNQWKVLVAETSLDPTKGLRVSSIVHALFLYAFVIAVLVVAVIGPPDKLMDIVDLLAQVLFMVSPEWLRQGTPSVQVVRVVVGVVVGHLYMVYKGSLFLLVSICQMLYNVFNCWRHQLTSTLEAAWTNGEAVHTNHGPVHTNHRPVHTNHGPVHTGQVVEMSQLVQSHWQMVQMVRETETIFSSTLQCFYATQVVTLCLELYLIAYRIGIGAGYHGQEAVWQTLIMVQTCIVFFLVSLKASRVGEEAETSVDVLRRGLPYTASDKDKFHFRELTVALTSSPVCITGGRFFTINRPFIITVVGAVLSYFIIVLQLKLPSVSQERALLAADNSTGV
ncbi:uncharacterized protein LOC121867673 [Homarus americanus]|uniref:uncharacterized protein LOC121867673 n=1 Tax=Homarus americanus TaxID=6706 RepID=UPI001C44CBB3|nr:uncharacterized protein LOC121867673 [Homarus americanus]